MRKALMKVFLTALAVTWSGLQVQAATKTLIWTGNAGPDSAGYHHFEAADNWTGGTITMSDGDTYNFKFPAVEEGAPAIKLLMPGGGKLPDGGKNFNGTLTVSTNCNCTFVCDTRRTYEFKSTYTQLKQSKVKFVNMIVSLGVNANDNSVKATADAALVFDDCTATLGATGKSQNSFAGDLTLLNESTVTVPTFTVAENSTLDIQEGSFFACTKNLYLKSGSTTIVDNSTFEMTGERTADISGDIVFRGKDARFLFKSTSTIRGDGTTKPRLIFEIPKGGYNYIPFVSSSSAQALPEKNTLRLVISKESPIYRTSWNNGVSSAEAQKIPLVGWSKGLKSTLTADTPDRTGLDVGTDCAWYISTDAVVDAVALAEGTVPAAIEWAKGYTTSTDTHYVGAYIKGVQSGEEEVEPPTLRSAKIEADIEGTVQLTLAGENIDGSMVRIAIAKSGSGTWSEKTGVIDGKWATIAGFTFEYGLYQFKVKVENSAGSTEWSEIDTFPLAAESGLMGLKLTAKQRQVVVTGRVEPVGEGESEVHVVWSVNNQNYDHDTLVARIAKTSASAEWAWTNQVANFGDRFYYRAYVVNGKAHPQGPWRVDVNGSDIVSADTATYYWQPHPTTGAWDGAWTEAAHWTADTEDHAAYPGQAGSAVTASFRNASGRAVEVAMPAALTIKSLVAGAANVTNRFVGAANGASALRFEGGVPMFDGNSPGQYTAFERIAVAVNAIIPFDGENQTMELKDAAFTLTGGNRFELGHAGGSQGSNQTLIVDNSTLTANESSSYTGVYLGQNANANGPCTLIVRGENPQLNLGLLSTRLDHDDATCARVIFEIPFNGYATAPIVGKVGSTKLDCYNGTITKGKRLGFLVDRLSPALMRGSGRWLEYELVDWPNGMYTEGPIVLDPGDVTPSGALRANSHVKPMVYDDDEKPTKILVEVLGRSGSTFMVR